MKTVSLSVNIPSDILTLLRISHREMEQEVQRWMALELFRRREISAGKAAEVAGLDLADFIDLTQQYGVAWVDYTEDELETEFQEAITLGEAARQRNV